MILFEINNIIIDFSISVNNFSCLSNDISGVFYEINPRYINYEKLYSKLPLYYDNLDELNDGIYLWMLLTCDYDSPKMFIIQCQNINEIGTKHSNIVHRLKTFYNKGNIFMHYAGELHKKQNEILMNLSSGSYMREIFEDNEKMNMIPILSFDNRLNYINDLYNFLNIEKYNKLNILFTNNDSESFIVKEELPLKIEHLNLYYDCNCDIRFFRSIVECKQYLENKKQWKRYWVQLNLYETNIHNYAFINPPIKPTFRFEGTPYYNY